MFEVKIDVLRVLFSLRKCHKSGNIPRCIANIVVFKELRFLNKAMIPVFPDPANNNCI